VKIASPPTTTRVINPRIRKTPYLLHSITIPPPSSPSNIDYSNDTTNHHVESIKIGEHDKTMNYSVISLIDMRLRKWLHVTKILKALQKVKKTIIVMKKILIKVR
jgi:hypothetical protein